MKPVPPTETNLPRKHREKLATLQRRADYLNTLNDDANHWDKQEHNALTWAITHIKHHNPPTTTPTRNTP